MNELRFWHSISSIQEPILHRVIHKLFYLPYSLKLHFYVQSLMCCCHKIIQLYKGVTTLPWKTLKALVTLVIFCSLYFDKNVLRSKMPFLSFIQNIACVTKAKLNKCASILTLLKHFISFTGLAPKIFSIVEFHRKNGKRSRKSKVEQGNDIQVLYPRFSESNR